MIYFDNAATTRPCKSAQEAVIKAMDDFGNPSSLHKLGLSAAQIVSASRRIIANSIGAAESEIYFTSGATEADNTAIFGAAAAMGKRKKRIVTTTVEHHAVSEPCKRLEAQGFEVIYVSPRTDGFHAEDIVSQVDDNICLVSCMLCNNETGAVLPVAEAFRKIKKKFPQTLTHCDAVQAYMKLPLKVKALYADMISLSGHKVHALKGIGALYVKKEVHIPAFMYGGGQERAFRSGTESVPLIAAFGAAVQQLSGNMDERFGYVKSLSDYLRLKINSCEGMSFNSANNGSPYVNSISVDGLRSEVLLHFLESKDIYVSSGSACSKGKKSSVLSEFHIPDSFADSTLRISFCADNTKDEIDSLMSALMEAQNSLLGVKRH